MSKITINGISFDPQAPNPAIATESFNIATAESSDYILVQTKQPLNKEQKEDFQRLNVHILEYIPDDTYLCNYPPPDLEAIRALPYVTWANIYMQGFKISKSLLPTNEKAAFETFETMLAKPFLKFSSAPKAVDIVFQKDVRPDTVRSKIAAAAHLDSASLHVGRHKARVTIQSKYLPDVASIDEVRHVEEVFQRKLLNDVARQIIWDKMPGPSAQYQGNGQTIVIADTGFDKGSTSNVHPAFTGRVLKIYSLGRPALGNDPDGHGTHVAGSALGNYSSPVLGQTIAGMAPKANLIFQSLLDAKGQLGGLPDDLHDLFEPPYQTDGARIHTNSWGSTNGDARYDSEASEVDDFVWNHRDFVVCFAAGNEGKDKNATGQISPGSLTPPGTAKNCITVGATENNRPNFKMTYGAGWPSDFPANPIASDPVANNEEGMAAFSSRGPTQDHRIKPDIVAPGTYILSTLSRDVAKAPGWDTSQDPMLFFDGGTSMATPLVAGSVAVLRGFLIAQQNISNPSAALVKALLINGAKAITGQYVPSEAGSVPSISEGFGRVDLANITGNFSLPTSLLLKDETTSLDVNESEQTSIDIVAGISLLKVTLVWTDPAGENLQNDLDLNVRHSNGQEIHGNMPASSKAFDRTNNVEQVEWAGVPVGKITIVVSAFRIAQDKQSYALVVRTA